MVEGARLESVYTGNRIAGSNPASSANCSRNSLKIRYLLSICFFGPTLGPTSGLRFEDTVRGKVRWFCLCLT